MNRRTLLAGAFIGAVASARRARAQATPVVGFLSSGSAAPFAGPLAAFRDGLRETGFAEGRDVAIEFRWAEGDYARLPALAADLVTRRVAVIATGGGAVPALAAKAATRDVPIVFVAGGDPVQHGLVASLNRPGGNVTGVNIFTATLESKRLALLHDMVRGTAPLGVLLNAVGQDRAAQHEEAQSAARALGRTVHVAEAHDAASLDSAFADLARRGIAGLLVAADSTFFNRRQQIVGLAERHRVPTIYEQREFALAGGLVSYGTNLNAGYRQLGVYAGRMLKGEKPAETPVTQATRFELVVNLRTARALGLEMAPLILAQADEVIE